LQGLGRLQRLVSGDDVDPRALGDFLLLLPVAAERIEAADGRTAAEGEGGDHGEGDQAGASRHWDPGFAVCGAGAAAAGAAGGTWPGGRAAAALTTAGTCLAEPESIRPLAAAARPRAASEAPGIRAITPKSSRAPFRSPAARRAKARASIA